MIRRIKVPFHLNEAGLICVKAKINNQEGDFIVDTGASSTVIDESMALYFGIKESSEHEKAGGLGTIGMDTQISNDNYFSLGDYHSTSQSIIVIDLSHVNNGLKEKGINSIHGIIGADILVHQKVIISYQRKYLTLDL